MPGSAIRVEERPDVPPRAPRYRNAALLVGVAGLTRQFTAAAEFPASGSQHDDAHEDQAAKDGPQPDEVEAGSAGRAGELLAGVTAGGARPRGLAALALVMRAGAGDGGAVAVGASRWLRTW